MRKPDLSSNAGNLEEVADWGRLLWVTFLGKTRKVTSCRSTTGGFAFECLSTSSGRTAIAVEPPGNNLLLLPATPYLTSHPEYLLQLGRIIILQRLVQDIQLVCI